MVDPTTEDALLERAVSGDGGALGELLFRYYGRLTGRVRRKLPDDLRSLICAEDVVQEAHVEAFRTVSRFRPIGENAFYRWLATVADQRLLDKIKAQRRLKRGGGRRRVQRQAQAGASSILSLINVVAHHDATPSRSIARRERDRVVHIELAHLKGDYREALRLRYIEGLPVAEIARRMGRTDRAVHMLCNRGLKKLREVRGNSTSYVSTDG